MSRSLTEFERLLEDFCRAVDRTVKLAGSSRKKEEYEQAKEAVNRHLEKLRQRELTPEQAALLKMQIDGLFSLMPSSLRMKLIQLAAKTIHAARPSDS